MKCRGGGERGGGGGGGGGGGVGLWPLLDYVQKEAAFFSGRLPLAEPCQVINSMGAADLCQVVGGFFQVISN